MLPLRSFRRSCWSSPVRCFSGMTGRAAPQRTGSFRRSNKAVRGQQALQDLKSDKESELLEASLSREWKAGDLYAPHDLSPVEMQKWKKRHAPPTDAFDALNIKPLDIYKNFSIMSEYMTPMGRIRHRSQTGLRAVNQRKLAKAIRRAIGIGIMPSVHRHPEILAAEEKIRQAGTGGFGY